MVLGSIPTFFNVTDAISFVCANPQNFAKLPLLLRVNQRVSRDAVSRDGTLLQYIPARRRTHELCRYALANTLDSFPYLPHREKTRELCLQAVTHNGLFLEFVPEKLRTRPICLAAVRNDGLAIEFVPKKLRNGNIAQKALDHGTYLRRIQACLNEFLTAQEDADARQGAPIVEDDLSRLATDPA